MTRNNRIAGNHIIIATKDGIQSYFNWHADTLITDKALATGYHSVSAAKGVIIILKSQFPGYTWSTENDK